MKGLTKLANVSVSEYIESALITVDVNKDLICMPLGSCFKKDKE